MMLKLLLRTRLSAFQSREALLLENAALRHQIEVLQRVRRQTSDPSGTYIK